MTVEVRYFSRGGNTRKLAEAIAQSLGKEALTTDVPLKEDVDIRAPTLIIVFGDAESP